MIKKNEWLKNLAVIYKDTKAAEEIADRLEKRLGSPSCDENPNRRLAKKDSILITYGDTLVRDGEPGIKTLHRFMKKYIGEAVSTVHFLPIYPYSSDDGFSVIDYRSIRSDLGTWDDIHDMAADYDLMLDAVINHVSKESEWFQEFLHCNPSYKDWFIVCDPDEDYSTVTRPRALPLLTAFETSEGTKYIWTTFSDDQIDLNFACPDVLIEIIDIIVSYARHGSRFIRLDAIGFLWKQMGTTCMHLDETHAFVKLLRAVLNDYAPETIIITETNVPQKENVSYFGDGDEAQLVYQFPLPPLVMFTLLSGNADHLTQWAASLPVPMEGTTYFNFLSSHDGIGIRPTEGILSDEERQILVDAALRNGGCVSYKDNGDGTKSPYELNINYQDALASPEDSDSERIARFLAAETILLSLQGLPGIYIHSLLGSRNDYYGKSVSGINRRINREKLDADFLEQALDGDTNRSTIFKEMIRRLRIRSEHPAFAPDASQEIRSCDDRIFAGIRSAVDKSETILFLINVSMEEVKLTNPDISGYDLLNNELVSDTVVMQPYSCRWIVREKEGK